MKLYSIEAIKGDSFNLYDSYSKANYLSEILFLRAFFRTLENLPDSNIALKPAYLKTFYNYYVKNGGDARIWLNRTIENISGYTDLATEMWLDGEIRNLKEPIKKPTARDIIRSLMSKIKEETKKGRDLETLLKEMYPEQKRDNDKLTYDAFRKAYYDVNKLQLGK